MWCSWQINMVIRERVKKKLKWRDMWPSIVTHTRNLCSAFNSSKVHTQQWTHTMNTNPEQWAAIYVAAPAEQLGVCCLAQGHLSCRGAGTGGAEGAAAPPVFSVGNCKLLWKKKIGYKVAPMFITFGLHWLFCYLFLCDRHILPFAH